MRKSTWMAQLERALSREGMTGTEKRTVLNYYEEMYQDRLDDGAEEEDIIKEFGFPEDVAQSVREHDEMSAKDEKHKGRADRRDEYDDYRDEPIDNRVPNYGAEANGYTSAQNTQYGAPQYSAPPQYGAPNYAQSGAPYGQNYAPNGGYAQNGAPNYAPNGNPNYAQHAPNTPPANTPQKSNRAESASIARTVISTIAIIVLFAVGIGLSIGGASVIIAAFAAIVFSTGVWLMAFGVGLVMLAIGCLIICSAVKLIKSMTKSSDGGAK